MRLPFYPIKVSAIRIPLKKSQYQSILLLGLVIFFVAHFTLLNPASLEDNFSEVRSVNPSELLSFLQNESQKLAKGVPVDTAPAYALRDVEYFATDEQSKHWKMLARKSFVYQQQQLVHARDVTFIWVDGTITAQEALSFQSKNEVELFGKVTATLNNGLVLHTEYVKIFTSPSTQVQIPLTESVQGTKPMSPTSNFSFESKGLSYRSDDDTLQLLSNVTVHINTKDKTQVMADSATYKQKDETLLFEMMREQSLDKQYVKTDQELLHLISRSLLVKLENQKLQHLTAIGDSNFKDFRDAEHPVSGTAGKIIYKEENNHVYLMDFPQVYQDNDTITGDIIIYDRAKDTIEVEQSNAFNKR